MKYDDFDENKLDEIPEGYFRCSKCGRIFSIDDQYNPDEQGDECNGCRYLGDYLQDESDDDEDCEENPDDIPEGYFRCSRCGRIDLIDDMYNPDEQVDVCNGCFYLGDDLQVESDDDENDGNP